MHSVLFQLPIAKEKKMKFKLIILILIHIFKNGHSLQFEDSFLPETNITHQELTKFLDIFSQENFANFLETLSMEQLSEKCLNHTQVFHQGLTSTTDAYWQLKSKKTI